jgi:hypothetical protein
MRPPLRLALLALLAALVALAGCRGCDRAVNTDLVGVIGSVDKVDLAPYVAAAHAIIAHAPAPAAPSPTIAGHRVFVTAWAPGKGPISATGLGESLFDSVVAASTEVAKTVPPDARVEVTVVTGAVKSVVGPEMRDGVYELGLHGYLGSTPSGAIGWVLPTEIVEEHRVTTRIIRVHKGEKPSEERILDGDALAKTIAGRAGVTDDQVATMEMYRFDVSDNLEPRTPGGAPVRLVRTMPARTKTVTPEMLLRGVHAGADYLTRMTHPDGQFEYKYDPVTDSGSKGYSMLRHAGTIYAMMCAYDEEHDASWVEAAKRAIEYMKTHSVAVGDTTYITDGTEEEQQKVGGAGLALVAFSQYVTSTGDKSDLEVMRSMGRFILKQQYADGHFRANEDVNRETPAGPKLKKEVWYYPGEAMLGLVRLYAIDPDPKWLAAAQHAADFLINVRDVKRTIKDQIPDHWLSYALHDLYLLTRNRAYAEHAGKISEEIIGASRRFEQVPMEDLHGAFVEEGESTLSATRLEALTSTMQLTRYMGGDPKKLLATALGVAVFSMSQQLDADSDYFTKVPAKAIGGVRESLVNDDIRIDYVQHAMCAWLRLARLLRDPSYGAAPHP